MPTATALADDDDDGRDVIGPATRGSVKGELRCRMWNLRDSVTDEEARNIVKSRRREVIHMTTNNDYPTKVLGGVPGVPGSAKPTNRPTPVGASANGSGAPLISQGSDPGYKAPDASVETAGSGTHQSSDDKSAIEEGHRPQSQTAPYTP